MTTGYEVRVILHTRESSQHLDNPRGINTIIREPILYLSHNDNCLFIVLYSLDQENQKYFYIPLDKRKEKCYNVHNIFETL